MYLSARNRLAYTVRSVLQNTGFCACNTERDYNAARRA